MRFEPVSVLGSFRNTKLPDLWFISMLFMFRFLLNNIFSQLFTHRQVKASADFPLGSFVGPQDSLVSVAGLAAPLSCTRCPL